MGSVMRDVITRGITRKYSIFAMGAMVDRSEEIVYNWTGMDCKMAVL